MVVVIVHIIIYNRLYPDASNSSGMISCLGIHTIPLAAACFGVPGPSIFLQISIPNGKILKISLDFQ